MLLFSVYWLLLPSILTSPSGFSIGSSMNQDAHWALAFKALRASVPKRKMYNIVQTIPYECYHNVRKQLCHYGRMTYFMPIIIRCWTPLFRPKSY